MNKLSLLIVFELILLLTAPVSFPNDAAADSKATEPPCSTPEFHQYDFWLGEWDLTWGEGDSAGTGTNIVTMELGDCVIEENFKSSGKQPFAGKSFSVYDVKSGMWKQTWVDNTGGYLEFVGEFKEGEMSFWRSFKKDGKEIKQRMIYYNIQENSLDWVWESSTDNGQTWKSLWKIHYQRTL